MSIIRFSCRKETLFAPGPDGAWFGSAFDGSRGRLVALVPPPASSGDPAPLDAYLDARLAAEAAQLPPDQPVVVMVNGFQFDPRDGVSKPFEQTDNPHRRVFHFHRDNSAENLIAERRHHTTGWPARLGFAENDGGQAGLAVAFGWYSDPGFWAAILNYSTDYHNLAYRFGTQSAWPLAELLVRLDRHPAVAGRQIHIFCHSLGSHVVLKALTRMSEFALQRPDMQQALARLGRVVLLGGSELSHFALAAQGAVRRALQPGGAGPGPDFYNFVIRGDGVLDHLAEKTHEFEFPLNQVVGHNGLEPERPPDWIDFQLDRTPLKTWLAAYGVSVSDGIDAAAMDHWTYFTNPGNMDFYARLFREPGQWDPAGLRNPPTGNAIPEGVTLSPEGE